MKDDEHSVPDRERRTLASIREEIDREFGEPRADAANDAADAPSGAHTTRRRLWLRVLGAVGATTIAAVALAAVTSVIASRYLTPAPNDMRRSARVASPGAELRPTTASRHAVDQGAPVVSDPGTSSLTDEEVQRVPAGTDPGLATSQPVRPGRATGRIGAPAAVQNDPCPPGARVAVSRHTGHAAVSARAGAAPRRESRPPATMARVDSPQDARRRQVEAP